MHVGEGAATGIGRTVTEVGPFGSRDGAADYAADGGPRGSVRLGVALVRAGDVCSIVVIIIIIIIGLGVPAEPPKALARDVGDLRHIPEGRARRNEGISTTRER